MAAIGQQVCQVLRRTRRRPPRWRRSSARGTSWIGARRDSRRDHRARCAAADSSTPTTRRPAPPVSTTGTEMIRASRDEVLRALPHVGRGGTPPARRRSSRPRAPSRGARARGCCAIGPSTARRRPLGVGGSGADRRRARARLDRVVNIIHDVTDQRRVELDNVRLDGEAQEAVRAREDLLAIVSHDLRNPLGVVLASTRAPAQELAAARQGGARPPPGRGHPARGQPHEPADPRSARLRQHPGGPPVGEPAAPRRGGDGGRGARGVEPLAAAKRCGWWRRRAGCWRSCDHDRVVQLFSNLVGNAIKFTPEGGTITVRAAQDGADRAVRGDRHGPRDPGRRDAARLRPLLPGAAQEPRGNRPRPFHRPRHRRGARRAHLGGERGGRGSTFFFTLRPRLTVRALTSLGTFRRQSTTASGHCAEFRRISTRRDNAAERHAHTSRCEGERFRTRTAGETRNLERSTHGPAGADATPGSTRSRSRTCRSRRTSIFSSCAIRAAWIRPGVGYFERLDGVADGNGTTAGARRRSCLPPPFRTASSRRRRASPVAAPERSGAAPPSAFSPSACSGWSRRTASSDTWRPTRSAGAGEAHAAAELALRTTAWRTRTWTWCSAARASPARIGRRCATSSSCCARPIAASIGVELAHLHDVELRGWLQNRMETHAQPAGADPGRPAAPPGAGDRGRGASSSSCRTSSSAPSASRWRGRRA